MKQLVYQFFVILVIFLFHGFQCQLSLPAHLKKLFLSFCLQLLIDILDRKSVV